MSLTIETFQGKNEGGELYKESECSVKAVSTSEENEKNHLQEIVRLKYWRAFRPAQNQSRYPEKMHVKDLSTEWHV